MLVANLVVVLLLLPTMHKYNVDWLNYIEFLLLHYERTFVPSILKLKVYLTHSTIDDCLVAKTKAFQSLDNSYYAKKLSTKLCSFSLM